MNAVLEVRALSQNFGGLRALSEVDIDVNEGEIVALIGPNGAGKTTFFNCITGIYTPTEGTVSLRGRNGQSVRLNGKKPNEITTLGMARTFQNIRLFSSMTVLENVMVGRYCRTRSGILGAILRDRASRREEEESIEKSYELLKLVNLHTSYDEAARNLSYGAQRRLEVARALATDPHLLLLDEPAAGMNPQETLELEALIRTVQSRFGMSILLIEHDMSMVMAVSDRIHVMEYGSRIASGTPEEIAANPVVVRAYLGEPDHA